MFSMKSARRCLPTAFCRTKFLREFHDVPRAFRACIAPVSVRRYPSSGVRSESPGKPGGNSGGSLLTHPLRHSRCRERLRGCPFTRVLRSKPFQGTMLTKAGPVAQRLEQRTHNPLVPGSNPGGPTNISRLISAAAGRFHQELPHRRLFRVYCCTAAGAWGAIERTGSPTRVCRCTGHPARMWPLEGPLAFLGG